MRVEEEYSFPGCENELRFSKVTAIANRLSGAQPGARPWLAIGVILAGVVLAYANSLRVPFLFDDVPSIVENAAITGPLEFRSILGADQPGGLTTRGRPVVGLSFAFNHAIGGQRVSGYHIVNIV